MVCVEWSIQLVVEKSVDSHCSQIASFVASDVAMYSASVVDANLVNTKIRISCSHN